MNKKLLSLFVASLLPVALLAGSGDVNGDGKVNIADIVEFLNYFKGNPSSDFNFTEADTNNDGIVDQSDVEAIAHTIMTDNLPHLYVLRHLYHIPSDYGHFKIFVSFVGDDAPLLTYPDGTISEPFFMKGVTIGISGVKTLMNVQRNGLLPVVILRTVLL